MKLHPTEVTAISGEELGRQIMAMRYDKVLEVLTGMKKETLRQHKGDMKRGYVQLCFILADLHTALETAEYWSKESVELCQKYIEAEIEGLSCRESHHLS